MKKHKLLEKAMIEYPVGAKMRWVGDNEEIFVSTGLFNIDHDGNVAINNSFDTVYTKSTNEWVDKIES